MESIQYCGIFRSTDLPVCNQEEDADYEQRTNKTTVTKLMTSAKQIIFSNFQLSAAKVLEKIYSGNI
jgi:hypothetical protein